jgi:hypothetical protein
LLADVIGGDLIYGDAGMNIGARGLANAHAGEERAIGASVVASSSAVGTAV